MTALATADLCRLGKFAALLASDNDGEALAALRAGSRLLAGHGLRWADVLAKQAPVEHPRPVSPFPVSPTMNWQREAMACRSFPHLFTEWERAFLRGIAEARSLTVKQRDTLRDLNAKVTAHLVREAFAAGRAA